jgi:type II secretory pathway component PulF
MYLLPKMVELLAPMMGEVPPLTAFSLEVSEILRDNIIILCLGVAAAMGAFYAYIMSVNGRIWFDKWVLRVPYIGRILRNTSSELFCRVLGILYTSGENIDAIHHAAESSRNRYLEKQIIRHGVLESNGDDELFPRDGRFTLPHCGRNRERQSHICAAGRLLRDGEPVCHEEPGERH